MDFERLFIEWGYNTNCKNINEAGEAKRNHTYDEGIRLMPHRSRPNVGRGLCICSEEMENIRPAKPVPRPLPPSPIRPNGAPLFSNDFSLNADSH